MERKDLARIMRDWAEDGVLEYPGHSTISGRYEGKQAIEAFFGRVFERMDTIRLTVRHVGFANPLALTYRNTMYVEFEADEATKDGLLIHTEVVGVYRIRRGRLAFYREYIFDPTLAETVWGRADAAQAA